MEKIYSNYMIDQVNNQAEVKVYLNSSLPKS